MNQHEKMIEEGRKAYASKEKLSEKQKLEQKLQIAKIRLKSIEDNITGADINIENFSKEIQKWQMNKIEYQTLKNEQTAIIKGIEKELSGYR